MTDLEQVAQSRRTIRLMAFGAVLVAIGGGIGLVGMTLGAIGAMSEARRRIEGMEVPPSELARRNWVQMKAAVDAGTRAWRDEAAAKAGSRSLVDPEN